MSQQNPFNFEEQSFQETGTWPSVLRPMLQGSGLPAIPGFGIEQQRMRRERFDWIADFGPHEPLADRLSQRVVLFPRTNRVINSLDGVFIPTSLFGEDAEIHYRQERRIDGSPQIVVFSISPHRELSTRTLVHPIDCSAEIRWVEVHRDDYAGLWVALDGDRIVSSGREGSEVYKAARESGVARPFLAYIEPTDELPFAGW